MKKMIWIFVLMFFISTSGFSQAINESFEGTFPPTGWTVTGDWVSYTNTAHSGTTSAYSSDSQPGGRMTLPLYSVEETTTFAFWLACTYPGYANATTLTVEVAIATEDALTWTPIQTISYPGTASVFEYHEVSLSEYANQDVYVSFNLVNDNGAGTIIDDVSLFNMTCPRPTNIAGVATMTTVDLTWVETSTAASYNIQIAQADQEWPEEMLTSTSASLEITDLLPATSYKVRVAAVCGADDESMWSDVYTFNTSCMESIAELPYSEPFNNVNCWTIMQSYSDYYGTYPTTMDWDEGNYVLTAPGSQTMIANSAPIGFDLSTSEVRFQASAYYYMNPPTITLGYVTSLTDTSTFVGMSSVTVSAIDFEEFTIVLHDWELGEAEEYYLAIKFTPNYEYDQLFMDNFQIVTSPTCPSPERNSVTVTPNADNAQISWVDNDEEHTAWIVYYREQNAEEWLTVDASEETITLTELTPNTTYEVYVVTDCGTDDNTDQTYTVQFTTTAMPVELPYLQDFEDPTAVSEIAFLHGGGGTSTNKWTVGSATAYISEDDDETTGNSMYISNNNGVSNEYTHYYDNSIASILVYFAPGMEYSLSFDYKVGGEADYDYLRIYALEPETPLEEYYNGTPISDMLYEQTSWTQFSYNIPESWIGSTKQIVFFWRNDGSDGIQPPAAVDNISIIGTTCTKPSGVIVSDLSETSATITWEGNADSYILSYYPLSAPESEMEITTSENMLTLSDLESATTYAFTLQSVCGEETSAVSDEYNFNTSCGVIDTPVWFEDFESVLNNEEAANAKLSCWYVLRSSEDYYNGSFPRIYWEGYESAAHSGAVTLEFKGTGFIALPEFATPLNTLQLSFYANTTASNVSDAGTLEVGYLTNVSDTSSFVVIATVPPVGLGRSASVLSGPYVFNNIDDSEGRIALRYTPVDDYESWNLDDFLVEPIPDCPAPLSSSVTVTNITDSEATISWIDEDDTHTQWTVYYKAAGDENYTAVNATEQTITLTGLEMVTEYTVYIQTNCGTENNLSQTQPITFRTTTLPITEFPYIQDFQDLEALPFNVEFYGTGANQWVLGTATGVETEDDITSSMYISSDNGTSYAYTPNSTSYAYAVVPISFGDDLEYTISFDYKVIGEADEWDFLKVILTEDIVVGEEPQGTIILNTATNVSNWTNVSYSSVALSNTTKKLVFYWKNDDYSYNGNSPIPAAIDNFSITSSSCAAVTDFAFDFSTETEATLSWGESEATSWTLYYKAEGETEYTSVVVTENPYELTDLQPATTYTAYIVADCSGVQSGESSHVSFRTQCATITNFPYFQSFEGATEFQEVCWETVIESGMNNWGISSIPLSYNAPIDGNNMARITYTYAVTRLITPVFDLSEMETPYLKFSAVNPGYMGRGEHIIVQYKASNDSEWTDLLSITTPHDNWLTDSIALPNASATYQIAFKLVGQDALGAALDAIYVYDTFGEGGTEPEPCDAPTELAASNITQTTAEISWNGTATSYEFKLNGGTAEALTATTKALTGLTANTQYTIEVRSVCDDQTSDWVTTTFTTLEEETPEIIAPVATTLAATEITHESAVLNGTITAGSEEITAQGFMYKATAAADWTTVNATGTTITATLTALTAETEYTFKAFATTATGTVEGETMTFTTTAAPIVVTPPTVVTLAATEITNATATLNGTITAGSEEITAQGFMYKASNATDWATVDATGETMTTTVEGLEAELEYVFKAFATTASGTVEGEELTFTTLAGLSDATAVSIIASVYPNPADDKATISVSNVANATKIVVSDMQGRIILSDDMSESTYELNTSNYASGVYYIRIISGNAVNTQKLIVK